jgi:hypothetical protein
LVTASKQSTLTLRSDLDPSTNQKIAEWFVNVPFTWTLEIDSASGLWRISDHDRPASIIAEIPLADPKNVRTRKTTVWWKRLLLRRAQRIFLSGIIQLRGQDHTFDCVGHNVTSEGKKKSEAQLFERLHRSYFNLAICWQHLAALESTVEGRRRCWQSGLDALTLAHSDSTLPQACQKGWFLAAQLHRELRNTDQAQEYLNYIREEKHINIALDRLEREEKLVKAMIEKEEATHRLEMKQKFGGCFSSTPKETLEKSVKKDMTTPPTANVEEPPSTMAGLECNSRDLSSALACLSKRHSAWTRKERRLFRRLN